MLASLYRLRRMSTRASAPIERVTRGASGIGLQKGQRWNIKRRADKRSVIRHHASRAEAGGRRFAFPPYIAWTAASSGVAGLPGEEGDDDGDHDDPKGVCVHRSLV